jgi:Family of unknown function (DUF6010)
MSTHPIPEFQPVDILIAVAVALVGIAIMSLLKHPNRRTVNAIVIAVAAGTYTNGGFGHLEGLFSLVLGYVAYRGLNSYNFIGIGWLMHTAWDTLHHFTGNPMIDMIPISSFMCFVCDPILAIWFFMGAPSLWEKMGIKASS